MPTPEEYAKQREEAQRKREHQAFFATCSRFMWQPQCQTR